MCIYARDLTPEEGRRVQHEIRHDKDPTFTRRCQVILCSAQGMRVREIAETTLLSEYHIRELIRTFNKGGIGAIRPKKPGKPHHKFTEEEKASLSCRAGADGSKGLCLRIETQAQAHTERTAQLEPGRKNARHLAPGGSASSDRLSGLSSGQTNYGRSWLLPNRWSCPQIRQYCPGCSA